MSRIALRLGQIKPSATLAMSAKAASLKAQGKNILDLSAGEPDFPTPEHIKDAAKAAIDANFTRYTPVAGIPALREAIAGYFARVHGVTVGKESAIASNGGKQILYSLLQVLVNPGEEVLLPSPYWVSYPDMIRMAEAEPVIVPSTAENGFLVTPDDLERAATPMCRALILNSPSNPTGCHYTQAQLEAIAEWAFSRGIFIISDEIYDQLVYEPAAKATLAHAFVRRPELVAVAGGLAKSFAMTGWRVGFCLAHPEVVKAMETIQSQMTSNICSIAQHAAVAALNGPYDCVESMRRAFARRRDLALSIIGSWDKALCPRPDGAFYLFPKISAYFTPDAPDSSAMCAKILDLAGVASVPGVAFGDDACLRVSYATDEGTLAEGLARIGQVLGA